MMIVGTMKQEEVEEEEKEKAGPVVGRQLKESQEREQEMKAHVQKLESQLERVSQLEPIDLVATNSMCATVSENKT